jgi:hypothetical protein
VILLALLAAATPIPAARFTANDVQEIRRICQLSSSHLRYRRGGSVAINVPAAGMPKQSFDCMIARIGEHDPATATMTA